MWRDLPTRCQVYLCSAYLLGLASTVICFSETTHYNLVWILLAVASFSVASINLRLPQTDVVVSMGDVFTMLVLLHFGAGPALVTYWANVAAATATHYAKRSGQSFFKRVKYHRVFFNLSCCAMSVAGMTTTYKLISSLDINPALDFTLAVGSVALVWFLINTGTLS